MALPFVAAAGVAYELVTAFVPGNDRFPFDRQRPLSWAYDTPGDILANTWGEIVAATVPSKDMAESLLKGAQIIPGPNGKEGPWWHPVPNMPGGPGNFLEVEGNTRQHLTDKETDILMAPENDAGNH